MSIDEVKRIVTKTGMPVAAVCDGGISPLFNHMTIVDGTAPTVRIERAGLVQPKALRAAGLEIGE